MELIVLMEFVSHKPLWECMIGVMILESSMDEKEGNSSPSGKDSFPIISLVLTVVISWG